MGIVGRERGIVERERESEIDSSEGESREGEIVGRERDSRDR